MVKKNTVPARPNPTLNLAIKSRVRRTLGNRPGSLEDQLKALTVAEVADRLQIEIRTAYGLIKRNELKARKIGRVWRVPLKALDDFLMGRTEAQYDDEQLSAGDLSAIRRGLEDFRAGRTLTLEELERKYGL